MRPRCGRYFTEDVVDPIAVVAGLVQTGLYLDFFYVYVTKCVSRSLVWLVLMVPCVLVAEYCKDKSLNYLHEYVCARSVFTDTRSCCCYNLRHCRLVAAALSVLHDRIHDVCVGNWTALRVHQAFAPSRHCRSFSKSRLQNSNDRKTGSCHPQRGA